MKLVPRLLVFLLFISLLFSFVSCSGPEPESSSPVANETDPVGEQPFAPETETDDVSVPVESENESESESESDSEEGPELSSESEPQSEIESESESSTTAKKPASSSSSSKKPASASSSSTSDKKAEADTSPKMPEYKYIAKVNYQANVVTIYTYDDNGNYTVPHKAMICSSGSATPKSGTYKLSGKSRWKWLGLFGNVYGRYVTQITGNILFHSVPYLTRGDNGSLKYAEFDKLGTSCSMGCIRLQLKDAIWIYNNKSNIQSVEFYASSDPGPLGKPSAPKISDNTACRNWDPTDTDPNSPWHNQAPTSPDTSETDTPPDPTTEEASNTEITTTPPESEPESEVTTPPESEPESEITTPPESEPESEVTTPPETEPESEVTTPPETELESDVTSTLPEGETESEVITSPTES